VFWLKNFYKKEQNAGIFFVYQPKEQKFEVLP
jgi:hypothetical protein